MTVGKLTSIIACSSAEASSGVVAVPMVLIFRLRHSSNISAGGNSVNEAEHRNAGVDGCPDLCPEILRLGLDF